MRYNSLKNENDFTNRKGCLSKVFKTYTRKRDVEDLDDVDESCKTIFSTEEFDIKSFFFIEEKSYLKQNKDRIYFDVSYDTWSIEGGLKVLNILSGERFIDALKKQGGEDRLSFRIPSHLIERRTHKDIYGKHTIYTIYRVFSNVEEIADFYKPV